MSQSLNIYLKRGLYTSCSIHGCDGKYAAKTFCKKHYQRLLRVGDPNWVHKGIDAPFGERFWSRVNREPGQGPNGECWEWTAGRTGSNYGSTWDGEKIRAAHHMAWFLTHGKWPGPQLLHSCDHPPCCRPSHLSEGTQKDNMEDKVAKNRQARGERNGNAVLTEKQVRKIKSLLTGHNDGLLAKQYGVSKSAINHLRLGITWRWLDTDRPLAAATQEKLF